MKSSDWMEGVNNVVLGFSGGVDSSVLLHLLTEYRNLYPIKISLLHVHHGVRSIEADRDVAFCEQAALAADCPIYVEKVSAPSFLPAEHVLRKLRHEKFSVLAKKIGAQRVFLAHHLDDQVETFLFRLFTGVNLTGLGAMKVFRPPYIVRPLLAISKDEIMQEAEACGVKYVFDSTNVQTYPRRNFLRKQLLPLIKSQVNPKVAIHLGYLAGSFRELKVYLDLQVRHEIGRMKTVDNRYSVAQYRGLPKALRLNIIQVLYGEAVFLKKRERLSLRREQLLLVDKMLCFGEKMRKVMLPSKMECHKASDVFYFHENDVFLR